MAFIFTPADYIFSNSLLLDTICVYLEQPDLAQLCQTQKQIWLTAIRHLWKKPKFYTERQLTFFSRTVGIASLFPLGNARSYGYLVQELDFTTIRYRQYCAINYNRLAPIFKACTRVKVLKMEKCGTMSGLEFERLFAANQSICSSLTSLDISTTSYSIFNVVAVIELLPNIKKLDLNRSNATYKVVNAISKYMPKLEWLDISSCRHLTRYGIEHFSKGCPKLTYLKTN